MIRSAAFVLLALACALGQQPAPQAAGHENLNAVLWMQTSAEYAAGATQAYAAATRAAKRALNEKHWTAALEQDGAFWDLPPAIVLDLDETVLDNSSFQAGSVRDGSAFTDENWAAWVKQERAGLVPGALRFLTEARAAGVAPFYITNRVCRADDSADPTVRLLLKLNVPLAPGRLLCKGETSDKAGRRKAVAATHRILLLIGDDLGDFVSIPKEKTTVPARDAIRRAYDSYWGERWFVLPNPAYGSWERAVGMDNAAKRATLRP